MAAGDKYYMSFGEPKAAGVSVETAVSAWMEYIEPYAAQGVSLGDPGSLQNPGDMEWTASFIEQCETGGCTIGFLCVHWYWTPGPSWPAISCKGSF